MGVGQTKPHGRSIQRASARASVHCNSSNGSSRVRFQRTAPPPSPSHLMQPELATKLWQNGSLSPQRRSSQEQVTEPAPAAAEPVPTAANAQVTAPRPLPLVDPRDVGRTVRAVVLAGGETKNPLTRYRSMPSVPLGSSLVLVDVPINNCLRAGINKIYVLTQFQSHTLNSHIASSYPPTRFGNADSQAWVDVLAAQQTTKQREWYQGSADAIRKNMTDLKDEWRGVSPATDYVILSGAAVYSMDLRRVLAQHRHLRSDITICTHLVGADVAPSKGIVRVDAGSRVETFLEKPGAARLDKIRAEIAQAGAGDGQYLANMGIYVFKREALFQLLDPDHSSGINHIGHHVIPNAIAQGLGVHAYQHEGYWHDVSTLRDYYEANLDLSKLDSPLKMFELDGVVSAKGTMLPPAQMQGEVAVQNSILDDGAVLVGCSVSNSVVGECVYVGRGSTVEESLLLGSPQWTNESLREAAAARGERVYGVGRDCVLRRCIVDEHATIGDGCRITNAAGVMEADRADSDGYMIQDGLVVIMRNAVIPPGTVI